MEQQTFTENQPMDASIKKGFLENSKEFNLHASFQGTHKRIGSLRGKVINKCEHNTAF